jgi:hypothetical protein
MSIDIGEGKNKQQLAEPGVSPVTAILLAAPTIEGIGHTKLQLLAAQT